MATCCVDPLASIAQELLDHYTLALVDCGRPACRYFVSASSSPAWDECCDCGDGNGQAWVQLTGVVPQNTSPIGASNCSWEYEATFVLGILRCAVVMQENGAAPDAEELTNEARSVMFDAMIARSAIVCGFGRVTNRYVSDFRIGPWQPLGPDGGCVGGAQTVTVRFSDYSCLPL